VDHLLKTLILAVLLAATPGFAAEAGYPDRSVRLIVPFPPGGGTDGFGRILGAKLTELWGQQVIIDNRGGAQGNIGTAIGAKAAPDGYTITLAHQGALTINPHLYANPGYDTLRGFAAVSRGIAIDGKQHVKLFRGQLEQRAVFDTGPPGLADGFDFVTSKLLSQRARNALVKQHAHRRSGGPSPVQGPRWRAPE